MIMKWANGKQQLTFKPDFPQRWLENPDLLPSMESLNCITGNLNADAKNIDAAD